MKREDTRVRIQRAVAMVREYREKHGRWPDMESPFIGTLDLETEDIEVAVETGALRVVSGSPNGARLEAP